MRIVFEILR